MPIPAVQGAPGLPNVASPGKPNFLSTAGNRIVDAEGREVRLTGVNWFGLETGTYSPHGLWARNWQHMLDQIVEGGHNVIRLPYTSMALDPNAKPMEGIDYELNPDLKGLNGLQIMDKIVEGAGKRGLKVILDRHRPNTEAQSKLWYTDQVPEAEWIADWQSLAKRYLGNDTVIGADLHNEPAGDATWGSGDPRTDWRAAAERAGNAILDVNRDWLIIVEGVEKIDKDWYWMGGSLQNAAAFPVNLKVPNKLVYSAHDYGPGVYDQEWFKDKRFPENMPEVWDKHWGYLVKQNIAPVLLGEFGGKSVDPKDREGIWQRALLEYLQENGISFTYWSFNPNSADTGGILEDDWQSVNKAKQAMLAKHQAPKMAVSTPSVIDRAAVAAAPRTHPLPEHPLKVQLAAGRLEPSTGEIALKLVIVNQTGARVPLEHVELRYWLSTRDFPSEQWAAVAEKTATWTQKLQSASGPLSLVWASTEPARARLMLGSQPDDVPYLHVTFGKEAGVLPSLGKTEVQLKIAGATGSKFDQQSHYSFKPTSEATDNEVISLYYWGERIWGREPGERPRA